MSQEALAELQAPVEARNPAGTQASGETLPSTGVPSVLIKSLVGEVLAEIRPVPPDTTVLKHAIAERLCNRPPALQKLVVCGTTRILTDGEALAPDEPLEVLCLMDETALWTWDLEGNPDKHYLKVDGSRLTCPRLRVDYCNVLTKEPLRSGRHYFEFVMHYIGDEQWCGVTNESSQAGARTSGRQLHAWTYYCGRMGTNNHSIRDGQAALHAEGKAVVVFEKPKSSGDVIGMLVDMEAGAIAFDLNGKLQGACAIPVNSPMWVLTHMDTQRDNVELRKPSLEDAPPANLDALSGAKLW